MVLSVVYKTQSQGVMMVLSVVCEDSLKDRLKFDKAKTAKPEWFCRIPIDPRDYVLHTLIKFYYNHLMDKFMFFYINILVFSSLDYQRPC